MFELFRFLDTRGEAVAQDDYYYEIQLTNKQLVFYFMAGATGLILSFLAGVMVGRSVEGSAEPRSTRAGLEERVVTEETPRPNATPTTIDLTYAQRLESERPDDLPAGSRSAATPTAAPSAVPTAVATPTPAPKPPPTAAATPKPTPSTAPHGTVAPTPKPALPTPRPTVTPRPAPTPASARDTRTPPARAGKGTKPQPGTFASQVGAFKDRATADQIVNRLRGRGYEAFVVEDNGLFVVRVGNFTARADAERVQTRLRDEEKFRPYIVKQ